MEVFPIQPIEFDCILRFSVARLSLKMLSKVFQGSGITQGGPGKSAFFGWESTIQSGTQGHPSA